ncbi:MAG: FlgD immunoglobulin-like domain containing protein, partial [bacterium]
LQYGDFFGPIQEVDFFIDAQCSRGKISFETGRRYAGAAKPDSGSLAFLRFKTNRYMPDSSCVQFTIRNISAQDSLGNPIVLLAKNSEICIRGPQVWAGDTNNDGIVNQSDWLPVGIYFNQQGPARRHASTAWLGQYATRWQNIPATFADADGNGRIANLDAAVVNRNWGKTWQKTGATGVPAKLLAYDHGGAFQLAPAYAATEKQWTVGVLAKNIDEVQALAFELSYPADFVEFAALKKPEADNWRVFTYDDRAAGTVGVGLCFGKQTGKTARIYFILKETAQENNFMGRGEFFQIEIRNVAGVDSEGRWIALQGQSWQREDFTTELPSDYPNPFNPATAISYQLPDFGKVHLAIFNVLGQKIRTLVNGEQNPGAYKIDWDGKDDHGMESPSGIYLVKLVAGEVVKIVQAVKLK